MIQDAEEKGLIKPGEVSPHLSSSLYFDGDSISVVSTNEILNCFHYCSFFAKYHPSCFMLVR